MSDIESLLARIQALEARLDDLCPRPNPSRVTPEGIPSFDAKKRIEDLEHEHKGKYYENWGSPWRHLSYVVTDYHIAKQHGDAMFDGIYYMIPKMVYLKNLRMASGTGNPLDGYPTILPDIRRIRNVSVQELHICVAFEFIPYLENFPSLRKLEIIDHPFRSNLNLETEKETEKKQKIYDYCKENSIEILCKE